MNFASFLNALFGQPRRVSSNRTTAASAQGTGRNISKISRSDRPNARFQTYQPDGEFSTKEFRFDFEYVAQTDGTVRAFIMIADIYVMRDDGPLYPSGFYDCQRDLHYFWYVALP